MSENYIYLDGEAEREQLIREIVQVRQAIVDIVQTIPENQWYEPRYDNRSLAAILGTLNLMDNMHLLMIKASLIGLRPALSLDGLRNLCTGMFRKRLVPTSVESIKRNEERIAEFIRELPMTRFSQQVYDPNIYEFTTVERALQSFFLHYWRANLRAIREVEGIG